jgi:hypothetical protein
VTPPESKSHAAQKRRFGSTAAHGQAIESRCQLARTGIVGYRGGSDCRILIVFHKPIMIAAAAPLSAVVRLTCANNPRLSRLE